MLLYMIEPTGWVSEAGAYFMCATLSIYADTIFYLGYVNCPLQVRVRSLWEKYYADAHGLIFVMDSADVGRFEEARMAFGECSPCGFDDFPFVSIKPFVVRPSHLLRGGWYWECRVCVCV